MDNIFAYTVPGVNYPAFVSVNRDENGGVTIIVRSKANPDGSCGPTAQITLESEELKNLAFRLCNYAFN